MTKDAPARTLRLSGSDVEAWLREAVGPGANRRDGRSGIPDTEECEALARVLPGVLLRQELKADKVRIFGLEAVEKLVRSLPRDLALVREGWSILANDHPELSGEWHAWRVRLDAKLAEAERVMGELNALADENLFVRRPDGKPPRPWTWHSAARVVRGLLANAYHRSEVRFPRSCKPESPIVKFIARLLKEAGCSKGLETVSDALRKRDGRVK